MLLTKRSAPRSRACVSNGKRLFFFPPSRAKVFNLFSICCGKRSAKSNCARSLRGEEYVQRHKTVGRASSCHCIVFRLHCCFLAHWLRSHLSRRFFRCGDKPAVAVLFHRSRYSLAARTACRRGGRRAGGSGQFVPSYIA